MRVVVHNHFTRDAEDVNAAVRKAQELDRLHYLRGVKKLSLVPDRSKWNAKYDINNDEVVLESKLITQGFPTVVRTILHEAGHRGQQKAPDVYEDFKRRGLNKLPYFLKMANPVHRRDFERKGKVDNIAEEAFAESYARYALGMDMPSELSNFWKEQTS